MAVFTESQAAAAAVGTDALANAPYRTSNRNRVVRGIAFVGSAAVNDAGIDVYVGEVRVARVYNSRAGANVIPNRDDLIPLGAYVPAGVPLTAPIFDAGLTNPTYLLIDISG